MAINTFPLDPSDGEHFVTENRLWHYNEEKDICELWGNLQYVPVPGETGSTGDPGDDGDPGTQGARGKQGIDGPPGGQGLQGEPGPEGTGITIQGSKDTYQDLLDEETDSAENGDVWIVVESYDGRDPYFGWVYNDRNTTTSSPPADYWAEVGPIRGQQGDQGDPGIDGDPGVTGNTGAPGPPGLNGAHGGAFCHVTMVPPTTGPKGKLYFYQQENSIYVTI